MLVVAAISSQKTFWWLLFGLLLYVCCFSTTTMTSTTTTAFVLQPTTTTMTTTTSSTVKSNLVLLFYEQDGGSGGGGDGGGNSNSSNNKITSTTASNNNDEKSISISDSIPSFISSPVLKQLYPELIKYKQQYGHPNIPLGTSAGRQCNTLRRLHIQQKLSSDEMTWLTDLGFTFHSLEDVYKFGNFDDLYQRLIAYEASAPPEQRQYQIPKKCPTDPELGAWVTGIRRLGPDGINPNHERQLNAIHFTWTSSRKCGSKFMTQYRQYVELVEQEKEKELMIMQQQEEEETNNTNDNMDNHINMMIIQRFLQKDPKMVKWVQAQQEALKRGSLSQTRIHYMELLFGDTWTQIGKETKNKEEEETQQTV